MNLVDTIDKCIRQVPWLALAPTALGDYCCRGRGDQKRENFKLQNEAHFAVLASRVPCADFYKKMFLINLGFKGW